MHERHETIVRPKQREAHLERGPSFGFGLFEVPLRQQALRQRRVDGRELGVRLLPGVDRSSQHIDRLGDSQARLKTAVERTAPFVGYTCTMLVLWMAAAANSSNASAAIC